MYLFHSDVNAGFTYYTLCFCMKKWLLIRSCVNCIFRDWNTINLLPIKAVCDTCGKQIMLKKYTYTRIDHQITIIAVNVDMADYYLSTYSLSIDLSTKFCFYLPHYFIFVV